MVSIKLSIVLIALTTVTICHGNLYNITVALKPGGTDQKGIITLLMQGNPGDRIIVNLSENWPIPAGMVKGYGYDAPYPANEISGILFTWYEMDHGKTWNGTILLDKVIIDPEYMKDKPEDRTRLTKAFCPDAKDVPLKSWKFITLRRCQV